MKLKSFLISIIGVLFVMMLMVGYALGQTPKEVKVGFQGVLSGVAAAIGDGARKGAEFLVEQINKDGGIKGTKVKLVVIDDKANPNDAVEAAKRLIEAENVVAIVNSGVFHLPYTR